MQTDSCTIRKVDLGEESAHQLCGSAARRLHDPSARRAASRKQRRGSAGPPNAAASAATASWAALAVALAHSALLVRFTLQDHRSIQPGNATDAPAKWLLAMARVANAPTAILGCDACSSSAVPAAGGAALGCADRVVGGTSLNRDRFRAAVVVCGWSATGAGRLPSMLWPEPKHVADGSSALSDCATHGTSHCTAGALLPARRGDDVSGALMATATIAVRCSLARGRCSMTRFGRSAARVDYVVRLALLELCKRSPPNVLSLSRSRPSRADGLDT